MAKLSVMVYLIRPSIKTYENVVRDPGKSDLNYRDLAENSDVKGRVYWTKVVRGPPSWAGFVAQGLDVPLDLPGRTTAAGVLLVKAAKRMFAFVFGHGRHLLDPNSYELDFGLRVALNSVDENKLKSIESRTFDENVLSTLKHSVKEAPLGLFGIGGGRELVAGVAGKPRDPEFGAIVAGKDALAWRGELDFDDIPKKCKAFLEAYEDDHYKTHFSWIDDFRRVRGQDETRLDDALLKALRAPGAPPILVSPPEIVDWHNTSSYRFRVGKDKDAAPSFLPEIKPYLDLLHLKGLRATLERGDLDDHALGLYEGDDTIPSIEWPLHQCLTFEHREGNKLFVLNAGLWYQVEPNLVANIDAQLIGVPTNGLALPPAGLTEIEPVYNARVARDFNYAFLDRKTVQVRGARTRVEVCDLLTPDQHLIHVKDRGSASKMSHLPVQVRASAEAFLADAQFRNEFRQHVIDEGKLNGTIVPEARPRPQEFHLVFAVMTKPMSDWPTGLPFLVKFSLAECFRSLTPFGFNLQLLKIERQSGGELRNVASQ